MCDRADGSGTTDELLRSSSRRVARWHGPGPSDERLDVQWPADVPGRSTATAESPRSSGRRPGAIGYVDLSDAKAATCRRRLDQEHRPASSSSPRWQAPRLRAANVTINPDLTARSTRRAGVYPITSPTWIIVAKTQTDKAKATAVKMLLDFILTDGQDESFTSSVNYAPLPKSLATKAIAQLKELQVP